MVRTGLFWVAAEVKAAHCVSAESKTRPRCAIYTRKSSEEGLEQEFNSLHAQREACEAYIKSQRHEGWTLVPTIYDDGGFSGATLERPAIKQLLTDVAAKLVHVVVVYKVDRLTRSLADFARIVETFDKHGASFVSVTQQFNTTSSMGRLTLNVLLSFAQFEREVTGERIRDKIGASKRKGLWMGGSVPLGYAPKDRTLVVVPEDADTVRRIFRRYLELGSVNRLTKELNAQGFTTKCRISKRGNERGGAAYFQGAIYHLLRNPIYVGEIRHKGSVYPGQHQAIIDRETWDQTQQCLRMGSRRLRGAPPTGSDSPLCGIIFDSAGHRMTPAHSKKSDGRRYRFYVSLAVAKGGSTEGVQIPRISAGVIELIVMEALRQYAGSPALSSVRRVIVGSTEVRIELKPDSSHVDPHAHPVVITVPIRLCRRGGETDIRPAGNAEGLRPTHPDRALLRGMIRAYQWRSKLESGQFKSLDALARAEKKSATYLSKLLPLAFLAPDLTEAILDGRQSDHLTLAKIRTTQVPFDWHLQRDVFALT
jgi:site-specific DNA recombinase